ncbi:hypothetical protein FDECE_1731 [Fusarium decemcellulare]|nr:hypothetical protein FDECE_1731 [Fusarium decemcellulare]
MSEDQQSLVARPYLSRRARACKQCRSAKVRCSGGRPCERCTRRRDPCAFISDENYVSVPEQYLRDLQRQLSELQATIRPQIRHRRDASPEGPRLQSPGVAESASDPSPHPHSAPLVGAPTTRPTERQAFPPSSSISADLGTPSSWPYHTDVTAPNISNSRLTTSTTPSSTSRDPVLANDHGDDRPGRPRSILVRNDFAYVQETHAHRLLFLGRTSTWTFCLRAFDALENTEHCQNTPSAPLHLDGAAFRLQWQAKSQVDAGDIANLPPMDHAFFLYHTVKFRLGELFRMIDEPRFLGPFEDFHRQPLQTAQEHRLWFVEYLLILAFGKALTPSRGPTANGPPGCELAARALSLLPDVAFLQDERPAVQAIEVLSLAALYFYAIDMRSPAYQYVCQPYPLEPKMLTLVYKMQIGQALRLALHDGLHRSVPDDVGPGLITVCRNAWWGVYVLDQEITAALGCPSAVPQGDITTPLPDAVSSEVSAKALSLRTRLSRLVSNISSCTKFTYGLDNDLGSDFIQNTTSILHSLAELSRDIDEITSAYKTGGGEPPHMFYNITLSHHHVAIGPPTHFEPRLLTGPIATLLEKSAQSATRILLTLKDLADREILEGFLPFQLEHAFSSAVLLCILSVFLPQFVPSSEWRQAVTSIFEAMIAKGSVVAGLRTAELEHLETLLGPHRPTDQLPPRPVETDLQSTSFGAQSRLGPGDVGSGRRNGRQSPPDFTLGRDDTRGGFDLFNITADDILALAQEFEHDDPSAWIIFDERGTYLAKVVQCKVAITGAASGMGLATAQLLAARGASLSLADVNETALKKAIDSLPGSPEKYLAVAVDVRKSASVDAWIEKTVQHFGKLDAAVNMAGVLGPSGPLTDITDEQLNFVFSVNANGVFNCLRAQLKAIKTGSIVSAASTFGQISMPNCSSYCASKAAVIAFSKSAAKENKEVRVNCVSPDMCRSRESRPLNDVRAGTVLTPMSEDHDPKRVESGVMANAQKRLGSASEVAKVIAFLISDDASFVTGAVYNVDGGWIY